MDFLNPLAGFLVGVLVGFTGVGGGALMTPLLVFLFGVAPQTVIGTDMRFAAITKGFGGWVHGARGSIDWLVLRRLVTLTSVGAGALGVVMLVCLYPYRITPPKLVGTDIAHAVPLTLVAGVGHWNLGNVDGVLLGSPLIGSIPGVVLGSRLSIKVDKVYVRNAIAAMLAVVGGKLLLQG